MFRIQLNRLSKELKIVSENPIDSIEVYPREDDATLWEAIIDGPKETPYEGGKFHLNITFPDEFPFRPPNVTFATKIFHPNINSDGRICIDILRDRWAASMTIQKVLLSIISLLSAPNPDDPLIPEIAILFKNNRKKFDQTAREWTSVYART